MINDNFTSFFFGLKTSQRYVKNKILGKILMNNLLANIKKYQFTDNYIMFTIHNISRYTFSLTKDIYRNLFINKYLLCHDTLLDRLTKQWAVGAQFYSSVG